MPGPGKHKKKGSRPRAQPSAFIQSAQMVFSVDAIDNAVSWADGASATCEYMDLPDLETRSGLKKVHRDFTTIYGQLDDLWTQNSDNDKVAGTVVLILTKMCSDVILRNKLVHEKDLLSRLMPLLDREACRPLALQSLCTITHHSDREIRLEIAKKTPIFLRILEQFPDDALCAEQITIIVGHSASAVISIEHVPDPQLLEIINLPRLLPLLLYQLKRPGVSSSLVDHALSFFVTATFRCSAYFLAVPASIDFLVACTRSLDIQTRSLAISSLIRLNSYEARGEQFPEDGAPHNTPQKREFTTKLNDAIKQAFGPYAETVRTEKAKSRFLEAMIDYSRDRDMYTLALEMVKLVTQTEHFVRQKCCWDEALDGPRRGVPFTCWIDAFHFCAEELRSQRSSEMLDMADILELKYLLLRGRVPEIHHYAARAIQRNPKIAYFYYAQTYGNSPEVCLQQAKKGLKCPNLSNYLKHALLSKSVESSSFMGLKNLEAAGNGGSLWNEGIALIMCSLEDGNEFIKSACPDDVGISAVLCLQPLMSLIIEGKDIGPDLREFGESTKKLEVSKEYARALGYEFGDSNIGMARRTIFTRMSAASREWDEAISRYKYEGLRKESPVSASLAAWLENVHLNEEEEQRAHMTHPEFNPSDAQLYRCSWCGNASAALRKCSRCTAARYCDASCQRQDWKSHKEICNRETRQSALQLWSRYDNLA